MKKNRISKLAVQKQKIYPKVGTVQYIHLYKHYVAEGMLALKEWLEEKKKVFFLPAAQLSEYDLNAPKGILMVGVPGCGKSLTAKLVAQEWDLPLFRLDMGAIFDKWVGESEKKMREALQFIENVSPCVLWIDEIEKVLSVSESGNDVGKRVLGEFLFWIQETGEKVFMVATANNVKALPYELYRKGRFSEVFFSGLPNKSERIKTLSYYVGRSLKITLSEKDVHELAELTEGYSYSDLEMAVKEVAQRQLLHKEKRYSVFELRESIKTIIPISKMNPELVREIEEWGKDRAVNVSG